MVSAFLPIVKKLSYFHRAALDSHPVALLSEVSFYTLTKPLLLMKFSYELSTALLGAAAIVLVQPQITLALTASEVNAIAEKITVLIAQEEQQVASGVIVGKEGNTYFVLTSQHVVQTEGQYQIMTPSNAKHSVNYSNIIKLPGIDLAILQFISPSIYQVATFGNSSEVIVGSPAYISGWPKPGFALQDEAPIRLFHSGQISARQPLKDGYELIYTTPTRQGMSGGPVLNENGQLIGIHGRTDLPTLETDPKPWGVNLGIPINTFITLAPSLYVEEGEIKLKAQAYQEAITYFNQVLKFNPNSAAAYNGQSYAHFAQTGYEESIQKATQAIKNNPKLAEAYLIRGASYAQQGSHRQAIENFNEAIAINSRFADAYALRGVSKAKIGDSNGAYKDVELSLKLAPKSSIAYICLSQIHSLVGYRIGAREASRIADEILDTSREINPYQMTINQVLENRLLQELVVQTTPTSSNPQTPVNPGDEYYTNTINLVEACKSYDDSPHQNEALLWLQNQIPKSTLKTFTMMWRLQLIFDMDKEPMELVNVCQHYEGKEHQDKALERLQTRINQVTIIEFAQRWFQTQ
ncbi:MAG: serine protease [Symploca sp. SIO2C1]|nr:serine protease [Symploca sp. SIO2C1]